MTHTTGNNGVATHGSRSIGQRGENYPMQLMMLFLQQNAYAMQL
jgi:hypothetical protein